MDFRLPRAGVGNRSRQRREHGLALAEGIRPAAGLQILPPEIGLDTNVPAAMILHETGKGRHAPAHFTAGSSSAVDSMVKSTAPATLHAVDRKRHVLTLDPDAPPPADHVACLTVEKNRGVGGFDLHVALDELEARVDIGILLRFGAGRLAGDLLERLVPHFLGTHVLVLFLERERLTAADVDDLGAFP